MEHCKRVIALGFFDGVHLGHGALLRRVRQVARDTGAIPAALTFDARPGPRAGVPLITSLADRVGLMRRHYGIEEVLVLPFDEALMRMPWEAFLTGVLLERYRACHLVAGHDFHFGHRGEGDPARLRAACARRGIGCDIIGQVTLEGTPVSSTHIRALLAEGQLEQANRFLGHPHVLSRPVERGKRLGTRLGFPTVNLTFPPGVLIPALGVYAARVHLENGQAPLAAVNIGLRPTVETSDRVTAEGYILDHSGELYGQYIRMELYHYLRPERKFASTEELAAEVRRNAAQVRALLGP